MPKIHCQPLDLISRRVGAKIREIKFKDCQQRFWFLITKNSAILYFELSRKIIFEFPEELQQTDLLQKQDGTFTLYGIESGGRVVTFDVTATLKEARTKSEVKKKSEDDNESDNISSKRFKKEEEREKESSTNEAIFHNLLTSEHKHRKENAATDNSGVEEFGKLLEGDIVHIKTVTVLHEDAQLVDCLLLDNILVTMTTCLDGYILSFYTIPRSRNDNDDQATSTSTGTFCSLFASFVIRESSTGGTLNRKSKMYNYSHDLTMAEMIERKAITCGLKLTSSDGQKVSSLFGVNSMNLAIFSSIFGYIYSSLRSEIIVVGTQEGKILSVPLKCDSTSTNATVSVLFDLEEPVMLVSNISLANQISEASDVNSQDCLIFVGKKGKVVIMYAEREQSHKDSKMQTVIEEKLVSGPVVSPIIINSTCLVYSTKKEMYSIRMELVDGSPSKRRYLKFTTRRFPVTEVLCISKLGDPSALSEDGDQTFIACLSNGRVVSLNIKADQQSEETVTMTTRQAGQRMKELMINIQEVTRKTEAIRLTLKTQNSVLTEMTKAGCLAGMLLSEQPEDIVNPFLTEIRTFLHHNGSKKQWMIECKITNNSAWAFDDNWTICAYICGTSKTHPAFKNKVVKYSSSLSKPVNSILHPLKNWNPDTFTVLLLPVDDGKTFLVPPIEIKLYLHKKSGASIPQPQLRLGNTFSPGDLPSSNATGVILRIGHERVDITNFLEPIALSIKHDGINIVNIPHSSARFGNGQDRSSSVAMETMHTSSSDWLSLTLERMMSRRLRTVQEGDTSHESSNMALKCPGIIVSKETMALLHQQDSSFLRWLFKSNSLVTSLLEATPSLTSLQLQSQCGVHVQIMQTKDDSVNSSDVKVQINTSSHQLLVDVMEAIHCKLAKYIQGCDKRHRSVEEDMIRLINTIQMVKKDLVS